MRNAKTNKDTESAKDSWNQDWIDFFKEPKSPFVQGYKRFFSIDEIEQSKVLQWFGCALLFMISLTFAAWAGNLGYSKEAYELNTNICWPHFQDCGKFLLLSGLPYGYSLSILYSAFFLMTLLAVLFIARKNWSAAHMIYSLFFLWIVLVMFFLTKTLNGNYWYFMTIFLFIFLYIPNRLFFLRITLVVLYFLAGTVKFNDGWILGTYFTSMATGFPLFPDETTAIFTNAVILMEIAGSWFLLSKNKLLQRLSLAYFICFHLYSFILVKHLYPSVILPALLILFGPMNKPLTIPNSKKTIFGWVFLGILIAFQFTSLLISGDGRYTLEGNFYGLYMFEANHQCIMNATVYGKDGQIRQIQKDNVAANNRCDPYDYWFNLNQRCQRSENVERITWTFDHSINGGPFYRIVDQYDACSATYAAFSHNDWIQDPSKSLIAGYPVKNFYGSRPSTSQTSINKTPDGRLILPGLKGQDPPRLNELQSALQPHVKKMQLLYWMMWSMILIYGAARFLIIPLIGRKAR